MSHCAVVVFTSWLWLRLLYARARACARPARGEKVFLDLDHFENANAQEEIDPGLMENIIEECATLVICVTNSIHVVGSPAYDCCLFALTTMTSKQVGKQIFSSRMNTDARMDKGLIALCMGQEKCKWLEWRADQSQMHAAAALCRAHCSPTGSLR